MTAHSAEMTKRYRNAESLLQCIFSQKKIPNALLFPNWIGRSDIFWYERFSKTGREYRLVNAREETNVVAFDHGKLAKALGDASVQDVDQKNLPVTNIDIKLNPMRVSFLAFGKAWRYEPALNQLEEVSTAANGGLASPNGEYVLFQRDYNLWLRHPNRDEETQLTFDGEEFFCYGAVGLAWGHATVDAKELQAVWSPDSKRILTVQRDSRHVEALPVLQNVPKDEKVRPSIESVKIAFPGEENVESYRIVAIDIEKKEIVEATHDKVPTIRNSGGFVSDNLSWWSTDSRTAYFVYVDRYYKSAKLVEFSVESGETRLLFEETTDTQIQLSDNSDESPTILPLPESNELVWYSNRSGWGHVYLYNTDNGVLKRKLTSGDWVVRDIVYFNRDRREIFLQTSSRREDAHPHHRDLIKVHLDTGELTELATGHYTYFAAHGNSFVSYLASAFGVDTKCSNAVSPTGNFFVVTRSRLDKAPTSIVCDSGGTQVLELEIADLTGLPDGWKFPERVKVLADDGETEVYGCIYRPSTFSEDTSYPVLSQGFNTTELSWLPEGPFVCDGMFGLSFFVGASLAELGFIVVQFAGRGTTSRSKEFLDHSYGCLERASSLADHVTGINQLSEKRPYMDLDRVGIISDQGGPGGVQGLLEFPDFYKVGVAAIIHDSRVMSATMWGDKFEGPAVDRDHIFPEDKVNQLQGKLLIIHGMLDTTSPPAGAFRIIEALRKANKNFDMLMLPCLGHDLSNYTTRRSWDYLVTHLLGEEPPHEYPLKGYHWTD